MSSTINRLFNQVSQLTDGLDREHWIVVFAAALVIGALLLRGFGSRTNY